MGNTYKIKPKSRKKLKLNKYNQVCKRCNENKVPRFHHDLCEECWYKLKQ